MLIDRLLATTAHFMTPPDGIDAGGGGGGGGTRVADGAAAGAAGDLAAAAAPGGDAAASPSADSAASTAGGESTTHESTPSLLSSAAGKTPNESPDQPAPAADAKPEPDAKAAETPDGQKPAETPAKPDDPGKESKPGETADAATDPAAKEATAAQPPALLSIDDLKLPDGASLDAEAGKAFVDALNNAELSGKDRGQALLDLHGKEIERVAKAMSDHQRKVWDDLNAGWKDDLRKDPELGGNRLNTSLSMAKAVVEEFLSPEDAQALLVHTDNNGMGNFPVFIRLLHNIGKQMNVFEDSITSGGRAPAPARGPGKRGWYNNTPGMSGT